MSEMAALQEARDVLKNILDPVRGKNIVELGMLKSVQHQGNRVNVVLELPTPVYRNKRQMVQQIQRAYLDQGVAHVEVEVQEKTLPGTRGMATLLPTVKNVIAVAAGKGGVGKSTVSTNLALALHLEGAKVGLLDADVYGPSIPTMLGPPDIEPTAKEGNKIAPAVHHGIRTVSIGFFTDRDGAVVWRGPMIHKLLQQFLADVEWGDLDYLVVDLPPGTGDAQLSMSQLIPITGAVIVTTPQEVALIDVEKAINMFQKVEVPVLGIVENMSGYACPSCGHHDDIFSKGGGRQLAALLKVPLLAELPIDARVRYGGDVGQPVVVGQPNGDLAKQFHEMAFLVAESILKRVSAGPKRPPGLVQIR